MFSHRGARRAASLRRSAFTLIELLVVIAIIAILGALSAAAVLKFRAVQPASNTRVALQKMQVVMHSRWMQVTDQAGREPIQGVYLQAVKSLSSDAATQRVIYIKIKQKQAFPETFFEALSPIVFGTAASAIIIPPVPGYVQFLKNNNITTGSATTPLYYESATCLLMALKRSVSGGTIDDKDLGISASVSITIVPGGAPCLIDGWGNPVGFCRWPLGNPNGTAGDPSDPKQLLWKGNWTATGFKTFTSTIHDLVGKAPSNLSPVIASPGANLAMSSIANYHFTSILSFGTPGNASQWKVIDPAGANAVVYSNNLP